MKNLFYALLVMVFAGSCFLGVAMAGKMLDADIKTHLEPTVNSASADESPLALNGAFAVPLELFDFGDAPDSPFPTLLSSDGARHIIDGATYLGNAVDAEADGQPNASADGDDMMNLDDEDGVTFLSTLVAGTPAQVKITASTGGALSAWIDFDRNGSWGDAGNKIFADEMLVAGENTLTFLVPMGAETGSTYARFRFSSQQYGLNYKGLAENGEVEDYQVEIIENQSIKWNQNPDTEFYGYHAHQQEGPDLWIADDWQCEGGLVTDLHWWGYYEMPVSGPCSGFRISIYDNDGSGPYNKPGAQILTWNAPFGTNPGEVGEYFTGRQAISGDDLYYYYFVLPEPFAQTEGNFYWLELMALSENQQNNVVWEWQTNGEPIVLSQPIQFDESGFQTLLERNMAFVITSQPESVDNYDFGDAPDTPYPTLLINDGARHYIDGSTFLGNSIDAEPDGLPNFNATGDDFNNAYDEDGVNFINPFVVGKTAQVKVLASKSGYLNAWIDFNHNGSWAETAEHIFIDQSLSAGLNSLTFNIPTSVNPGVSYIRFRFNTNGGLNYYGPADNGEVEDYRLIIYPPDWDYTPTGSSHIISIPLLTSFNCIPLSQGDFMGTFYTDENGNPACGGATIWDGINNQTLVAFGDDITTTIAKEGFNENEDFLWKVYYSSTGIEEEVIVTYNPGFPHSDGKFHDNGISGLTSVLKKMTVSASAYPDTICQGETVQLSASVVGGCGTNGFSWTSIPAGFSSTLQNPTDTPTQTTYYTVVVTNTFGDAASGAVTVTVLPLPEITSTHDSLEICVNSIKAHLTSICQPFGGIYSGTGVYGGEYFYPDSAGIGYHTITYTYTAPETGCTNTLDFVIQVKPLPQMDCPPYMEACEDDPPVLLNSSYPLGGVYTGTGVYFDGSNYWFDPSIGSATYIINYCFTDPVTGCENCCEFNFYVYPKPNVTCPEDFTICLDTSPFALSGAIPIGGVYSGPGVSGGIFDPAAAGAGTHEILYTYVDPQTFCEGFCIYKITVIEVIAECPDDFEVCIDNGPIILSGGLPAGGYYSGTAVSGGVFHPGTAGVGSHIITYTYVEPGTNCSGSCEFKITVKPLPQMDCPSNMQACEDDPPVMLNSAYPQGGIYTGTGVSFDGSNYWFDPTVGVGVYLINYCYTDADSGCENCCEFNFYVIQKPEITCPEDFSVCIDTPAFPLNSGNPANETYSGDGVSFDGSNYMFDASIAGEGTHEITYTFTDPDTSCENSCTFYITVILVEAYCPDGFEVCVNDGPVTLSGGLPLGGYYSGPAVSGGVFHPGTAGVGSHIITYTYVEPGTNCSGSCEFIITVKPLPQMDCPPYMEACEDDPPVLLNNSYPQGGVYTGTGVSFDGSDYWFDPSIGAGTYIINYCFTDPDTGCENCCEFNFYVYPKPDVTCPEDFTICLDTSPFALSGAIPVGGVYSGAGVSGGMFDPAAAGAGTHEITYTFVDPQTFCENFCTFNITVILVEATCPDDFEVCIDEGPVTLSGGLPVGGTYWGTGVSGGIFYPGTAGVGSHIITYTYVEPGTNCAGSCEFKIVVKPLPQMDCPPYMEACEDDPPVLLNTSYPLGGVYTGTGVYFDGSNYWFDPSIGSATYIINYCFTDPVTGCENCCEFNFYVYPKPDVTCPEDFTICLDTSPFALSGAIPVGGVYSGAGVSGGMFDPAAAGAGTHEITYTFVDPQTFCENFCTFNITVILVEATCPDDFEVCIDEGPVTLSGGLPVGGTYWGTGVSGGIFYPGTAGVGSHIITYTYVEPGTNCAGSCEFKIVVKPLPQMDCPPYMEACEDDPPVLLNSSYPLGGVYTGTGVYFDGSNYWFDPAVGVGVYLINYCFTDPVTGCENCCEFNFIVHARPEVTCPEDFAVCLGTSPFALAGAMPAGGTYLGDGVSGGIFDPAAAGIGSHEILYTYVDPQTLCEGFCTFNITVIEVPEVICPDDMVVCINDLSFELTGASPEGGVYAGPGVLGGFFNPAAAGVGTHVITYTVGVAGTNCFGQCEFEITVKPLPQMDCPPYMEACEDDPPVLLNSSYPLGGVYTGTGVYFDGSNYWFDPSIGSATYIINYCFTDPVTGCENCCEFNFYVYPKPNVTCPEDFTICLDTSPFALSGAIPVGGVYSGAGVSGGMFDPAAAGAGTHEITYTFVDPQTFCENFCTFNITVILVEATCPDDFEVCIDEGSITLSGGLPVGGTYWGTGVSGGIFYPGIAGVGSHIITYTYVEPGTNCAGSCEFQIVVKPLPQIDCPGDMELCLSSPTIPLDNAYPIDGTYSGEGVFFDNGFYYFDPSLGVGEYEITYCFTDPVSVCTNCCSYIIKIVADQVIDIPEGWSGISSYIEPYDTDMEAILYPITYQLTILSNNEGIYWPGGNTFTLSNWDVYSGYVIKVSEDTELPLCGLEPVEKTVNLNQGWNIMPVLSSYPYETEALFNGVEGFELAKEVAGTGIYWETFGINSMPMLNPGKSYYVRMNSSGSVNFDLPLDDMPQMDMNKPQEISSPWNEVVLTPGSHIVVFNTNEIAFELGDIVGGFTTNGNCAGIAQVDNTAEPFTLNLNGDDVFTSEKEGFESGEALSHKLYRPSTGETFDLLVTYNAGMNTGQFEINGLSEITGLKLSSTGLNEYSAEDISIYPNPSNAIFNIVGTDREINLTIFNTFGEEILTNVIIHNGTIDLTGQPNGVYFVRIETANGSIVKKLVKE